MKNKKRPVVWMTLAQIVCAVPLVYTGILLIGLTCFFVAALQDKKVLQLLILSGIFFWAAAEAFCICGRMKRTSAFSAKNVRAFGRIALALAISGGITLCFGDPIISMLLSGLPAVHPAVARLLLPFILLTLAAMVRAVQLLMRRTLAMQEESDLTV